MNPSLFRAVRPLAVLLVLLLSACDVLVDTGAGPGLLIRDLQGNELVRVEGATVQGSLQVPVGTRLEIEVLLIDGEGNVLPLAAGESLRGTVTNSVLARLDMVGSNEAVLRGLRTGGTTVIFDLLVNGMAEDVFPAIPVEVI